MVQWAKPEQAMKRLVQWMLGERLFFSRTTDLAFLESFIDSLRPCATEHALVRLGPANDGGYLVPDDLEGIAGCVSPGVSTEVGFDLAMANMGIDVYMADASVDAAPAVNPRFHFIQKFLDVCDGPKRMRLEQLVDIAAQAADADLLLQMDIEGSEYCVLLDTPLETLTRFRIMVIEFHSLSNLLDRFSAGLIHKTFAKLLRTHVIVHIHPNNIGRPVFRGNIEIPPTMEFTFHRKDRVRGCRKNSLSFPHHLDSDNRPDRPTVVLPACWW